MRKGIHPTVGVVQFRCVSCNTNWLSTSTNLSGKVEAGPGGEYPTIVMETCSNCHPFYTNKQTMIDTAGRIEKFNKRFRKAEVAEKQEGE